MTNELDKPLEGHVERVDVILDYLAEKNCFINFDRSWFYWDTFLDYLKQRTDTSRYILKAPAKPEILEVLNAAEFEIAFMPIVKTQEEYRLVEKYANINTVAVELIFKTLDAETVNPNFMDELHQKGLLLWANTLTLNKVSKLCGDCDDHRAVSGDLDGSFGKLLEMGFDIIQTDWPYLLSSYIKNKQK